MREFILAMVFLAVIFVAAYWLLLAAS